MRTTRRSPDLARGRWPALPALALLALACGGDTAPSPDTAESDVAAVDAAPEDTPPEDACAPLCPVTRCAEGDGCGGTCPPCPSEVSCEACALVLRVVERDDPFLRLALDFAPTESAALPSLADLRLNVAGDATLLDLTVGDVVVDAGKAPFADPQTGEPWQLLADGTVRVSLGSLASDARIPGGRWLTYRFRLGGAFEPITEPVVLRLSTAEAVLAPPDAASVLWGQPVDEPVALWPTD